MEMLNPGTAVFLFLAVSAVALFSMIAVARWAEERRKERETYYKNDMLKRLAEAPPEGAQAAFALIREQDRMASQRMRQGLRISGLIVSAAGLGTMIFLRALIPSAPIYLSGAIPLLVGLALFGSSFLVTARENQS